MTCGRLSYSIIRALTRVATPATEPRLMAVACGATRGVGGAAGAGMARGRPDGAA